jgi:hypothetical protein
VDKLSIRLAACLVLALAMASSALCAEKEKGKKQDEKVALDQVPAAVKDASVKAVASLTLTEAEKEVKNGAVVYELKGTASGKEYEVKVSADGKVLKAEEEKGEKEEKAGKKKEKDDDDGDDEKDDDKDDDKDEGKK